MILLMMPGNTVSGNRSKLNSANDTKAFSGVKMLLFDEKTYAANVVMHTFKIDPTD